MSAQLKPKTIALEKIACYLYELTGVSLKKEKYFLIENRLSKRLRFLKLSSFEQYFQTIKENIKEREIFISTMTTHKTFFNRESQHFLEVEKLILQSEKKKWLFLSAACSTGEEVYTLAAYLETLKRKKEFEYKILGIDICGESIRLANLGRYKKSNTEEFKQDFKRYFEIDNENLVVKDTLKNNIKFRKMNLLSLSDLPENLIFDIVLLRNVLIYFDDKGVRKVIDNIEKNHCVGGKIFIGMSEHINHPKYKSLGVSTYEKMD